MRHLNRTLSGAPGERADFLLRLAPLLRAEVEKQGLADSTKKSICPWRRCWRAWKPSGCGIDKQELEKISTKAQEEIAAIEKRIYELAGFEFKINPPQQLAEVLFDRLSLAAAPPQPRESPLDRRGSAGRAGADSRAAQESPGISRAGQGEVHLCRRSAAADSSRHRALAHALQPDGHGHRAPQLRESESAEYSGAHGTWPRNSRGIRRSAGPSAAFRRLFADRAADSGASFRGSDADGGVSQRRGHPFAHRPGSFRRGAAGADARASPRREGDQFRRDLRPFALRSGPAAGHRHQGRREIHRRLFRALQRREKISRLADRRSAQIWIHQDALRPHPARCRKSLRRSRICAISPSAPP